MNELVRKAVYVRSTYKPSITLPSIHKDLALSPRSPVRSRRQRIGSEGQAALRETQEGRSPILSLHHMSHLFSRLAGT